jgi:serine O-acetyltransferase
LARLQAEAAAVASKEHLLARFMARSILGQESFTHALAALVSKALEPYDRGAVPLGEAILDVMQHVPDISELAAVDLQASYERNPAWLDCLTPFLHSKGFHAIACHRAAHELWRMGQRHLAQHIHGAACGMLGVDIHPAAVVGRAIFLDHGTGFVVGETASIGDSVSILHGVTLGGTGNETGDRHPIIESGVLLGAHAIVLGRVRVGSGAKVAAGSVVLEDVPPNCTVAGVPARIVRRRPGGEAPALTMDQEL